MRTCGICREPAVKSVLVADGRRGTRKSVVCYLHGIEAGDIDAPLAQLQGLSAETGYPVNGLCFVLETLIRRQPSSDAGSVCEAVVLSARERFAKDSNEVMAYWGIRTWADIKAMADHVVRANLTTQRRIDVASTSEPGNLPWVLSLVAKLKA